MDQLHTLPECFGRGRQSVVRDAKAGCTCVLYNAMVAKPILILSCNAVQAIEVNVCNCCCAYLVGQLGRNQGSKLLKAANKAVAPQEGVL